MVRNVAPECYGGGEIYQLKLADKLREYGFSSIILTNSRELLKEAEKEGIKVLVPPYCRRQNWSGWRNLLLPFYCIYQRKLKKWYERMVLRYNPVTINIQSRDDMIAGTEVALSHSIDVLWTDHADFSNWVLWNVNTKFKNLIGKRMIKLSKDTKEVIFVSKKVEEETKK